MVKYLYHEHRVWSGNGRCLAIKNIIFWFHLPGVITTVCTTEHVTTLPSRCWIPLIPVKIFTCQLSIHDPLWQQQCRLSGLFRLGEAGQQQSVEVPKFSSSVKTHFWNNYFNSGMEKRSKWKEVFAKMLNFVFVNLDVKAVGICIVGHRGRAFYISWQIKLNGIGGLPFGAIFLSTENKDKILCILRNGLTSHCWNIFSQNNPQRNATSLCMTVIFSMAKALCNGCLYCNHVCPWIEVPLIIDRDIWFDKHNRKDVWLYKRQVC